MPASVNAPTVSLFVRNLPDDIEAIHLRRVFDQAIDIGPVRRNGCCLTLPLTLAVKELANHPKHCIRSPSGENVQLEISACRERQSSSVLDIGFPGLVNACIRAYIVSQEQKAEHATQRCEAIEDKNAALRTEKRALIEDRKRLRARLEDARQQSPRLLEENVSIQRENATLRDELDDAQMQIGGLQQMLSSLDSVRDSLAHAETVATSLRTEIKNHLSDNEGLRNRLEEAVAEKRRAKEKGDALNAQIAAAKAETQRLTDKHRAEVENSAKAAKAAAEASKKELEAHIKKLTKLEARYETLRQEKEEAERERDALRAEVAKTPVVLAEPEAPSRSDVEARDAEIARLRTTNDTLHRDKKDAKSECDALRAEMAEKDSAFSALRCDFEVLQVAHTWYNQSLRVEHDLQARDIDRWGALTTSKESPSNHWDVERGLQRALTVLKEFDDGTVFDKVHRPLTYSGIPWPFLLDIQRVRLQDLCTPKSGKVVSDFFQHLKRTHPESYLDTGAKFQTAFDAALWSTVLETVYDKEDRDLLEQARQRVLTAINKNLELDS